MMRTIRHKTFTARLTHLYHPDHKYEEGNENRIKKYSSLEFQTMVRGKSPCTMDVVCAVGRTRFIENTSRDDTKEEIYQKYGLTISTGTISNYALEFLIRFEMYHYRHFNRLVDAIEKDGGYILGVDGTGDGGSDRILLLMDLLEGWALSCGIIPSEKEMYITPFFDDLIDRAGNPLAYVRDMGGGLRKAGDNLPPGIPTKECDFHFTRDVGKDMMTDNYQKLRKIMVRLNVRSDLVKLRKALNHNAKSNDIDLRMMIRSLKENKVVDDIKAVILTETYHVISWILNYNEESHHQRFPYSLPWVYLYRRCNQGMGVVSEILSTGSIANINTDYIKKTQEIIERPFHNETATVITDLENCIEKSHELFLELRKILRIPEGKGDIPRDQLFITDEEALEVEEELKKFRDRLSAAVENGTNTPGEKIMLDHLIRHWNWLLIPNISVIVNGEKKKVAIPRAISLADARFSQVKRGIRKRTGKKDTKYELNRYGAPLCLIQNLHSDEYVEVMFGSMKHLPAALGSIPKEEVEKAMTKFRDAQCRYDITGARGEREFEVITNICKKVREDVESSTIEKSSQPLLVTCDEISIPTDS